MAISFQDWATESLKLGRNPDVSVRSRGVMEKCTYCVQRIRYSEIVAEREHRAIKDGEVVTACQAACPSGAIMFGDLNQDQYVPVKKDDGTLRPEHVSMGKMGNVRGALEVARMARTVLGGNGITLEYPVIRHMNNLETVLTYEGTHEVHTLSVGKALTGENAFR